MFIFIRAKHTSVVIHHSLLVLSLTDSSYTRRGHVPALHNDMPEAFYSLAFYSPARIITSPLAESKL